MNSLLGAVLFTSWMLSSLLQRLLLRGTRPDLSSSSPTPLTRAECSSSPVIQPASAHLNTSVIHLPG